VLRAIASSPADVESALNAIVESACALCDAYDANVLLRIGDHLHFSIMLYGVHVDPVEWWDGKWIRDHVTAKLEQYPRATVTARRE